MPSLALVQAPCKPFDLGGSTQRACALVDRAADENARIVVFGETWLGGYPAWIDHWPAFSLWDGPGVKELHARYRGSCPTIPGPELAALEEVSRRRGCTIVLGVSERVDHGPGHGTLYNSLVVIEGGGLVVHHRKLVPTHTERLVWGPGDADGLVTASTPHGRVGGLICWEHWMPLARQALHDQAEQIHVAMWPTVHEAHQIASRHYAFEGRCFVAAAGNLMHRDDLPESLATALVGVPDDGLLMRGGSCVVGPDGRFVLEPVFDREAILHVELDLSAIERERLTLDVTGHSARPDVLRLHIERGRRRGASKQEVGA